MKNETYTLDEMHPEDAIYKVKTFIRELQKVQNDYINQLVKDLNLNQAGEEWLFDYIYNSDENVDGFSHYLQLFKKKYEDLLFNEKGQIYTSINFELNDPMLHMTSYEPDLETLFPNTLEDSGFPSLSSDVITTTNENSI